MASIVISGDTSGSVTLQAPAVAGSTVLNLPSTSGTIQTSGAGYTTNGVAYATSTSALSTGSALAYNGTRLLIGGVSAGTVALSIPAGDITSDVSSGSFAVGNYGDTSSELRLSTRGFTTFRTGATDGTNGTEQMRLTSTGLGIGTTSPAAKLDVVGRVLLKSTTDPYILGLGYSSSASAFYYIGSSANTSPDLIFTNGAVVERMRLTDSGNLFVGTTNGGGQTGVGIFTQTAASDCLTANATSASFTSAILNIRTTRNTTNGTFKAIQYYNDGASAQKFYVIDSGAIYSTSTSITSISDQRFKENIKDIDVGLDSVMALKPRRFDWIDGKGEDRKNAVGFIAQEMQTVLPDLISTYEQSPEDTTEYLAIRQSDLIPTLVKAIQEQQALITTLTDRISVLENK